MTDLATDTPLVSVVIPTKGRAPLLRRAIQSVLDQTYSYVEVIVVVDGPDPEAEAVVAEFGAQVKSIPLPASLGPGGARNRGVDAATGAWVAFLDDDDEWLPQKLTRQMALVVGSAGGRDLPFCFSRIIVRNGKGDRVWPSRPPRPDEDVSEYLFARRRLRRSDSIVATITWLLPTDLMRRLPFDASLPRHEDADWLIRAIRHHDIQWLFVPEPTAVWNLYTTAGHVSENDDWRFWFEWAWARRQLMSRRAYAGWMLQSVAGHAIRAGERRACTHILYEALVRGRPSPFELVAFAALFLTLRKNHPNQAAAEDSTPTVSMVTAGGADKSP